MKLPRNQYFRFAICLLPLAVLLVLGLVLSAVELSAGWLNDHCVRWFKEIYEA